jgi:hypothetical protein
MEKRKIMDVWPIFFFEKELCSYVENKKGEKKNKQKTLAKEARGKGYGALHAQILWRKKGRSKKRKPKYSVLSANLSGKVQ